MNRFHILTLFPKMVMDGLNTSIIGRAIDAGLLEINAVNIRDYSTNKHMKVDDYPYGGGAGLVMQPEPVYRAYKDLTKNMKKKPRVVYLTDEIGTPYCVTFDFDSLEDNAVTVRDRDTMEQERIKIEDLKAYFAEKFAY